jgi:hypothetical protein
MSASACFPEHFLLVSPPAAVAEEVLRRLGRCPFTPPAFVTVPDSLMTTYVGESASSKLEAEMTLLPW